MSYHLGFISDEDILTHVTNTIVKYQKSHHFKPIGLKEFNHNLVDAIKLTFDSKIHNQTVKSVIDAEILRQADKSNTNHIGYFHQNIFKYLGSGWVVPEKGYDIENHDKNIFIEIKNKHNTMNSSSSAKTYMRMQDTLLKKPGATCMLVEVIAKKSQNVMWETTLEGRKLSHENIRRVSIDKFYEIVTGDRFAFKKLCERLPKIITDAIQESSLSSLTHTVFDELNAVSPDLLKNLYLLSFKTYEGFDDLDIRS